MWRPRRLTPPTAAVRGPPRLFYHTAVVEMFSHQAMDERQDFDGNDFEQELDPLAVQTAWQLVVREESYREDGDAPLYWWNKLTSAACEADKVPDGCVRTDVAVIGGDDAGVFLSLIHI